MASLFREEVLAMECGPGVWLVDGPFRAPEWRWMRACYLHERGDRTHPPLDDESVHHALRLLADGGRDGPSRQGASDPVRAALDIWRGGQALGRYRLEAFLLTREPLEVVAGSCGLPIEVVEAYHEVFFEVRPWLAATDWVLLQAVGCGPWNNFGGGQLGPFWKYVGYAAGPRVLEAVIAITNDEPLASWVRTSGSKNPAYEESRLRLLGKLTLAAMTAQSEEEMGPLLEARERLRVLDCQAAGAGDGRTGLLPAMEGFLGSIGGRRKSARKPAAERPESRGRAPVPGKTVKARRRVPVASLLNGLT
jgi:hypothetical protein